MNLYKFLPATREEDGTMDPNDTCQRAAMLATAIHLRHAEGVSTDLMRVGFNCMVAFVKDLQPRRGIMTRYKNCNPNNCSGDQMLSALAYFVATRLYSDACWLSLRILLRGGFAQNTRDGLNDSDAWKMPDFILFRALPLMLRAHWIFFVIEFAVIVFAPWHLPWTIVAIVVVFSDAYLLVEVITKAFDRNPDHVDDNILVMTFAAVESRGEGLFSWAARKLYGKTRPWNYGCLALATRSQVNDCFLHMSSDPTGCKIFHPVFAALMWYHRAEAGGNPEIALAWKPICDDLWGA